MKRISSKAFTLIELLVVIAIIGILSGLIVVSLNGATNSANDAKRKANLDTIRKALIVYGTLNKEVYPIETSGCNIGPVGAPNRCANLAAALTESLPILPVDPVSGYYTYVSATGSDFNLSSVLSSGVLYGYSRSKNYYSSVIARSSYYSTLKNKITSAASIDDSTNGALSGYVSNFTAGWTGQTPISSAYGFQAVTYDVYVRIRSDGLGTSPTSVASYIYDSTTSSYFINAPITGLTTSYQIKYFGRFTLSPAQLSDSISTDFSLSGVTTNYYIDYIEFRPVP